MGALENFAPLSAASSSSSITSDYLFGPSVVASRLSGDFSLADQPYELILKSLLTEGTFPFSVMDALTFHDSLLFIPDFRKEEFSAG